MCSSSCVCVDLKYTLVSRICSFWNFGPLNTVISKKFMLFSLIVHFTLMESL